MKRTPLARISKRQQERKDEMGTPKFGTLCGWCKTRLATEWDHLVLRSLLPGESRDHRDNLMPSCRSDNRKRSEGRKPAWSLLSHRQQEFVLQMKGPYYASRYFTGAPS